MGVYGGRSPDTCNGGQGMTNYTIMYSECPKTRSPSRTQKWGTRQCDPVRSAGSPSETIHQERIQQSSRPCPQVRKMPETSLATRGLQSHPGSLIHAPGSLAGKSPLPGDLRE